MQKKTIIAALIPIFLILLLTAAFYRPDISAERIEALYADSPASRFVTIDGVRIHYRDNRPENGSASGKRPLVLLHGTFASLHTWEGWIEELDNEQRIITLDLPGFGLTGPDPSGDYSMERTLFILDRFLDAVGAFNGGDSRIHIGGNSLGGSIAWNFVLAYPDQCASLILIDSAGYHENTDPPPLIFRLARMRLPGTLLSRFTPKFLFRILLRQVYGNPEQLEESTVERYYLINRREGNRTAFLSRTQQTGDPDTSEEIPTIALPTLILWGEKDRWISPKAGRRFNSEIPDSSLVLFAEAGHVPMEEQPVQTAEELRLFLSPLAPAGKNE